MDSTSAPNVQLSARELAERLKRGDALTLVDVREPFELALASFPEVLHIPLSMIPLRMSELPADRTLVMVCHHGNRSMMALRFLNSKGVMNVLNLEGGIEAWSRDVDPSVARY